MKTILEFASVRASGRRISVATAYDAWSARLVSRSPVDCILVGDSVAMVVHGLPNTIGATVEMMALHTEAVSRGAGDKLIIADLPFLSYRRGIAAAVDAAGRLMRAGAHAVKLEGLRGHEDVVRHLVQSGIPVMGHLGMTPQSVMQFGGFKVQGRQDKDVAQLTEDVAALAECGAFSVVLECIPREVGRALTAASRIPTIGIGAGADCDGQVLVFHDLLGLQTDLRPRFVRAFAQGESTLAGGLERFHAAVVDRSFPSTPESYG